MSLVDLTSNSTGGATDCRRGGRSRSESVLAGSPKGCGNAGHRGFTLLELLVAVSIFSLLGAGLATVFSTGLQVKKRARSHEGRLQVAGTVFGELQRNLRNVIPRSAGGLSGNDHEVSFLAEVPEWRDGRQSRVRILRLNYRYDSASGGITRTVSEPGGASPVRTRLAGGGVQLKLAYAAKADELGGAEWEDTWSREELPIAVRISLLFPADGANSQGVTWHRVACVPLGERIEEQE